MSNEDSSNTNYAEEEKQNVDNLLVISQLRFELSVADKASDARRKDLSNQIVKLIVDNGMYF